ncbi:MAG: hypothetical protein R2710_01585 [Acidimicrobiales bacterium]
MGIIDYHQRNQIRATQKIMASSQAAELSRAEMQADKFEQMQARFDRLRLATESMWLLVKETTGLTEEHLIQRIEQLDSSDGTIDGRRADRVSECSCGAMVNARAAICVFCGAEAPERTVFDRI